MPFGTMIRPALISRSVLLVCAVLLAALPAEAQTSWRVSAAGSFVQPTLGMADRFGGHVTGSIGVGQWLTPERLYLEGRIERYAFSQGAVVLRARTEGPEVETEQFNLSLDLLGGGFHLQRTLLTLGMVRPYATGGIGMYHWQERRAAYEDEHHTVPELERAAQWSAGFHGGLGTELLVTRQAAVVLGAHYTVIMGELWPALALGLENVSSFQFANASLGIRYSF
jgi:opacity protein-like surface antigen